MDRVGTDEFRKHAARMALMGGHWSLSTMCIGVGQGIAIALERV